MNNEEAIKAIVKETCEGCLYIETCQKEDCAFYLALKSLSAFDKVQSLCQKRYESHTYLTQKERDTDFYNKGWNDAMSEITKSINEVEI